MSVCGLLFFASASMAQGTQEAQILDEYEQQPKELKPIKPLEPMKSRL
jgi:hypothetical protein